MAGQLSAEPSIRHQKERSFFPFFGEEERLRSFRSRRYFGSADGWPAEGLPAGGGARCTERGERLTVELTDRRKKTASILNRHQLSRLRGCRAARQRAESLAIALRESGVTGAHWHRSSKEVEHGSGEAAEGGPCIQCPAWGTVAGSAAPPWRCGLIGRAEGPGRAGARQRRGRANARFN